MRIGESGEERRQAVRQLFQLAGAQSAHRSLQCAHGAPGCCPQDLLTVGRGMDLYAALIALVPATLDPASRHESFQDVAYGRPLHPETCSQSRSGNSWLLADARERAMHRNGCVSHALELAVQGAHAIDECARGQQRLALYDASVDGPGCATELSFSP
jgi:hypothetical protein